MFDRETLNGLYRYGLALTRDSTAAYDLLQDALEAFLNAAHIRPGSELAYLRRCMRNHFIDQQRRLERFPLTHLTEQDVEAVDIDFRTLDDLFIAEQEVEHLLSTLKTRDRELLFLWAVEGWTAQEIADYLQTPRGTVLSRIHRLRARLRDRLDEDSGNPDQHIGGVA